MNKTSEICTPGETPSSNMIKFEINSSENKKFHCFLNLNDDNINFYFYTENIPKKQYEKSFSIEDFYNVRYFRMFDNLEEIFDELNNLINKVPYFIGEETSKINLIFEINQLKFKEITFCLEESEREQKDVNNEIYELIYDNKVEINKIKENYDKEINNLKKTINDLQIENNNLKNNINNLKNENEKNKNDILKLQENINNILFQIKDKEINKKNIFIKNNNIDSNSELINNKEKNNKNKNNNIENNKTDNNNNENNKTKHNNNEDNKIIFDNLTIKEYNTLKNWILSDNNQNKDCSFEILYDSNITSKDFHESCDNQTNTLTLIETKNKFKFGGYTECAWSSNNEEKVDKNSFLFSLNNDKKYIKKDQEKSSIYCDSDYGPFFGSFGNNDIVVNGNIKKGSVKKNGNFLDEEMYKEINGGKSNFIIKNLKVFKIVFK